MSIDDTWLWRGKRRPHKRAPRHPLKRGAELVIALLREGRTYQQVADLFGVTPQAVWKFADDIGLRPELARRAG